MDFEEMQVIWDSQKERSMYALDIDALHASLKRKGRGIERSVNAMEIGMIAITGGMAAMLAAEPILNGTDHHQFFGAALLLIVAAWLLLGRLRRRRHEHVFESSLVGDLSRSLSQIDHHISLARKFQWWFLLPALLITLVDFVLFYDSKPIWNWPVLLVGLAAGYLMARLELRRVHLPQKRDLEALRAKLMNEG